MEYVQILVPPEHLERVKRHLGSNDVLYEVLNDQIQRQVYHSFVHHQQFI